MTQRLGLGGWFLVALFLGSGTLRLVRPEVLTPTVPDMVPRPRLLVQVSGVAELVCALGLAWRRTRRLPGWTSFALLLAVFPANVQVAVDALRDPTAGTAYLVGTLVRLPLQLPLLWVAWRASRREPVSAD